MTGAQHPAVVVVPIHKSADLARRAIESIARTCPAGTPLVLVDDASKDDAVDALLAPDALAALGAGHATILRNPRNLGFPGAVNVAVRAYPEVDVVVVNSDVVVPSGWYEALTSAAAGLPRAATLSVLANNGTMLSVPFRNSPRPDFPILAHVDALARASAGLGPVAISNAVGHVLYLTRKALDAVGMLDEAYAPGYGEEVDFSLRAAEAGFVNYLVPGVAVHHEGSGSFGAQRRALIRRNARLVEERYPYVWARAGRDEADRTGALAATLAVSNAALRPVMAHAGGGLEATVQGMGGDSEAVQWNDHAVDADVLVVPVGPALPESLHVQWHQRLVVLLERTDLITNQWMHLDTPAWEAWLARARSLCTVADVVLARDVDAVVVAGLAEPGRTRALPPHPVPATGGGPGARAIPLLLGPVDSKSFLTAAHEHARSTGGTVVVGQPVPQTWVDPLPEPSLGDGPGLSLIAGYRGRRSLAELREAAGGTPDALVWRPLLDEVRWAAGGSLTVAPTEDGRWLAVRLSGSPGDPDDALRVVRGAILAAASASMNPARHLLAASADGTLLFLAPPAPRASDVERGPRADGPLGPRSIINSLRYEGVRGSWRKARRRLRAKGTGQA